MRLHAVGPRHRADEPGLQEGAPLVNQTAVASVVILYQRRGGGEAEQFSPSLTSSAVAPLKTNPGGATHTHSTVLVCKAGKLKDWGVGGG